ncbi:MAG: methylenetetrahydrofolate reductase C-terminal domain-containing protein [Burkholderiales bacterium]|jgi:methylenetetrahydrofolate reductase (NADPH)|nr:methylenetetrahydrofolate reductase C-terminal domain-containing protein [Burkholderiales bacterium]
MNALARWSVRHAAGLERVYRWGARWAPRLAPLARGLGLARSERWLRPLERAGKGLLFDCRMCGQCVLGHTGMACPMNCAKQLRNGPCGGVRADGGCEVKPQMRCVWLEAGDGQRRAGSVAAPWLAPLDRRRSERSTWIQVIQPEPGAAPVTQAAPPDIPPDIRPKAPPVEPVSAFDAALQDALRGQGFAVTVEIAPPDSPDPAVLLARAERFRGLVDAINITDGAGGNCHMSSVAAASVLVAAGFEPVCQVGCRDRNRIAVQGDVLGAAALGVRNVLCLTGDDVSQGDHPQAKPVFDLDAVNLLGVLQGMTARGTYASGRPLEQAPRLFLGATANPFVPPFVDRVDNLERKIDAGARFIQTQFCFDLDRLRAFLDEACRRGLHRRAALLIGVGTLPSAKGLKWMAEHVPGVAVPDAVITRIAAAEDQRAEGRRVCIETIHALQRLEGVAGIHLMGHRNEATLAQVIVEAGLRSLPGRPPESAS